jgi:hypothetical protein
MSLLNLRSTDKHDVHFYMVLREKFQKANPKLKGLGSLFSHPHLCVP